MIFSDVQNCFTGCVLYVGYDYTLSHQEMNIKLVKISIIKQNNLVLRRMNDCNRVFSIYT